MKLLLLALAKPLFATSLVGIGYNYQSIEIDRLEAAHGAAIEAAAKVEKIELEVEVLEDEHADRTLETIPVPPVEESPEPVQPNP